MRLLSLSIDLDEVSCYAQIHGSTSDEPSHAVYDRALARIKNFASDLELPLTLFVVARDLQREASRAALAPLLEAGHEIGNHSLDHLYDLTLRSRAEQEEQVDGANRAFKATLGCVPSGFRAPGYTVNDELLAVVRDSGLVYDSSVFPCPTYFAAKAASLLKMKVLRRNSRAILDSPRVLSAPTRPYRLGQPYWARGDGLLELPIQVAGPARLPFIGTSLALLGPAAARLLALSLVGTELINLELHGIDFLEARDVPASIAELQPDLRVPLTRKVEAFAAVVELFRKRGYGTVRLDEAARAFA